VATERKGSTLGKTTNFRQAVEDELSFEPLVDSSRINVMNIGGEVALNGTVPSYPQYLAAGSAARRVIGVTRVNNYLAVSLPAGDYRDGVTLTAAANDALTLDVTVPIGVRAWATDCNVTLTGTVNWGSQRAAAGAAVAGLIGVRNVKNDIAVSRDADALDVVPQMQSALDRYSLVPDDTDIVVDTDGGIVSLVGHVRTWAEHDAVVNAAWMTNGVWGVRDDLLVTG
jgi:osmotically-inducible protein OsmY